MHRILERKEGKSVGIEISSKLTKEDYQGFVPFLEEQIEEHGKINLLIHFKNFEGVGLGAFWEDIKFDIKHYDDFNRVAVVGEKAWMEWMTKVTDKLFPKAEAKHFEPDELQDAWMWLKSGELAYKPVA